MSAIFLLKKQPPKKKKKHEVFIFLNGPYFAMGRPNDKSVGMF